MNVSCVHPGSCTNFQINVDGEGAFANPKVYTSLNVACIGAGVCTYINLNVESIDDCIITLADPNVEIGEWAALVLNFALSHIGRVWLNTTVSDPGVMSQATISILDVDWIYYDWYADGIVADDSFFLVDSNRGFCLQNGGFDAMTSPYVYNDSVHTGRQCGGRGGGTTSDSSFSYWITSANYPECTPQNYLECKRIVCAAGTVGGATTATAAADSTDDDNNYNDNEIDTCIIRLDWYAEDTSEFGGGITGWNIDCNGVDDCQIYCGAWFACGRLDTEVGGNNITVSVTEMFGTLPYDWYETALSYLKLFPESFYAAGIPIPMPMSMPMSALKTRSENFFNNKNKNNNGKLKSDMKDASTEFLFSILQYISQITDTVGMYPTSNNNANNAKSDDPLGGPEWNALVDAAIYFFTHLRQMIFDRISSWYIVFREANNLKIRCYQDQSCLWTRFNFDSMFQSTSVSCDGLWSCLLTEFQVHSTILASTNSATTTDINCTEDYSCVGSMVAVYDSPQMSLNFHTWATLSSFWNEVYLEGSVSNTYIECAGEMSCLRFNVTVNSNVHSGITDSSSGGSSSSSSSSSSQSDNSIGHVYIRCGLSHSCLRSKFDARLATFSGKYNVTANEDYDADMMTTDDTNDAPADAAAGVSAVSAATDVESYFTPIHSGLMIVCNASSNDDPINSYPSTTNHDPSCYHLRIRCPGSHNNYYTDDWSDDNINTDIDDKGLCTVICNKAPYPLAGVPSCSELEIFTKDGIDDVDVECDTIQTYSPTCVGVEVNCGNYFHCHCDVVAAAAVSSSDNDNDDDDNDSYICEGRCGTKECTQKDSLSSDDLFLFIGAGLFVLFILAMLLLKYLQDRRLRSSVALYSNVPSEQQSFGGYGTGNGRGGGGGRVGTAAAVPVTAAIMPVGSASDSIMVGEYGAQYHSGSAAVIAVPVVYDSSVSGGQALLGGSIIGGGGGGGSMTGSPVTSSSNTAGLYPASRYNI